MQVKKGRSTPHWLGQTAVRIGVATGMALAGIGMAHAGPLDTRASACMANPGGNGPSGTYYSAYNPALYQIQIPLASQLIIPSQPVRGQVLLAGERSLPYLEGGAAGAAAPLITCPAGTLETFHGNGALVPGMSDVYLTSVSGIGYRVYYYISSDSQQTAPVSYVNPYASGVLIYPVNNSSSQIGSNVRTRIELVATGAPILPGTISMAQVFGLGGMASGGGATTTFYRVGLQNNVVVSQPTCGITNPSALTVILPDVSTRLLATAGVGPQTDTTLQVSCNAAREDAPAITLTTTHLVAEVPGTLGNLLTGGTAAQGVGVQVRYEMPSGDYTPFVHGTATHGVGIPAAAPPTNQWLFRLGARFVRLGAASDLKPGQVRAIATLTFTYN